jgi:5-methylcytosine-specific restriction endonuclease McrA
MSGLGCGDGWDERTTREAVKGRSGGICELCRHRATEMHHRKARGMGGGRGKWSPANILHLCGSCHRWATRNPLAAYERGVSLRDYDIPDWVPVTRDDGSSFQPSDDVLKAGKNG